MLIVAVFGVKVKFVEVAVFHALAPLPEIVKIIPAVRVKARTLLLLEEKLLLLRLVVMFKVPWASERTETGLLVPVLESVTVMPAPSTAIEPNPIAPTKLKLAVSRNVTKKPPHTTPGFTVKLPAKLTAPITDPPVIPAKLTTLNQLPLVIATLELPELTV